MDRHCAASVSIVIALTACIIATGKPISCTCRRTFWICYKQIWVPPKIRVIPSESLPETLDLGKFRHGKLIVLSTKLVDGGACGSHLQQSMHSCWTHIVYCKSVDCNPPTPLLQFVLDLLYNLFLQSCSS